MRIASSCFATGRLPIQAGCWLPQTRLCHLKTSPSARARSYAACASVKLNAGFANAGYPWSAGPNGDCGWAVPHLPPFSGVIWFQYAPKFIEAVPGLWALPRNLDRPVASGGAGRGEGRGTGGAGGGPGRVKAGGSGGAGAGQLIVGARPASRSPTV